MLLLGKRNESGSSRRTRRSGSTIGVMMSMGPPVREPNSKTPAHHRQEPSYPPHNGQDRKANVRRLGRYMTLPPFSGELRWRTCVAPRVSRPFGRMTVSGGHAACSADLATHTPDIALGARFPVEANGHAQRSHHAERGLASTAGRRQRWKAYRVIQHNTGGSYGKHVSLIALSPLAASGEKAGAMRDWRGWGGGQRDP